mmetsp:Transcript_46119/g.128259  ORF Transcript_46119/g.128259 Transcript_46119/m.128259 type:complete len:98 (+) Transcript_46119:1003-1296(+)
MPSRSAQRPSHGVPRKAVQYVISESLAHEGPATRIAARCWQAPTVTSAVLARLLQQLSQARSPQAPKEEPSEPTGKAHGAWESATPIVVVVVGCWQP